jgi:hypothetical protein
VRAAALAAILLSALLLTACDYGPSVSGGQPTLAMERVNFGGSRSPGLLPTVHYYEVSAASLDHPAELKAYFRWRCTETYLPSDCRIDAWLAGTAPHHHSPLSSSEIAAEAAAYQLDKRDGKERFALHPFASR